MSKFTFCSSSWMGQQPYMTCCFDLLRLFYVQVNMMTNLKQTQNGRYVESNLLSHAKI